MLTTALTKYKLANTLIYIMTWLKAVKAGSQNDASLALHQLRCDKILKTDWSNATQLTQR